MLEWDDITRHWWRYDNDRLAMVHRASGETVAYRDALPAANWHRFEYEHDDQSYPLIVELKVVRYPNPNPESLNIPPWNTGSIPFLRRKIWHVDHQRSCDAWQKETGQNHSPPYWFWKRIDIAVSEAGLLWPEKSVVPNAEEIAVNGGWANGEWREQFYRRIFWCDPLYALLPRIRRQRGIGIALPLSDHVLTEEGSKSPRWFQVEGPAVNSRAIPVGGQVARLQSDDGTIVALPVDRDIRFSGLYTRPITTLWDNWFLTTAFTSTSAMVGSQDPVRTSEVWEAPLNAPAIVGMTRGQNECAPLYGKTVVTPGRDFLRPRKEWSYSGEVITHPLSSYPLWRQQHEIRINALTFSNGFDMDAPAIRQGDVGTVNITGGYIGGIQGMEAKARLTPNVKMSPDSKECDWQQFF